MTSATRSNAKPLAVITGSGGALGSDICAALRSNGYRVAGLDLLAGEASVDAAYLVDVRAEEECHAAFAAVAEGHGKPRVLVNAAGVTARGQAQELSVQRWREVLDINLTGTFIVSQAFDRIRTATGACIVNISSIRGIHSQGGSVAYSVSKAGVLHLTKVLAREWGPRGCRVNAVAPSVLPDRGQAVDLTSDSDYVELKTSRIPLGHLACADDVVAAVSYLISPKAGFINGVVLPVDGGEVA
ncbi:MAG: SDR family NAD(P)-dependent oxidoreductase [Acidimicrobiales bacterium]